ncbi:uncharacterized protein LOC125207009 [Salvia hispanica]|uniref:uncharacterized protein LOC125207009 n=1 Tax=Salvia hispanica TaxID=49212 RepID=UPI0020090D33|nr:uncharacterized protein LOC125207009 [Salvia hispanica]
MEFPISDVAVGEDLIGAFLRRQGVDAPSLILDHQDDVVYKFHHHKLILVSSSSSSFQEEDLEEENSDDDDEEDYSCRKSELICDGCITPIFLKQTSSSSSSSSLSSSKDNYYYMRCSISSCKYYLHLACFLLPTQLSSLPLLHEHENDHSSLVLRSGDKLKPWECSICSVCSKPTNGLFYGCTKCNYFRVDIKCASMPDTIYHAAHPNHLLNLRSAQDTIKRRGVIYCDACGGTLYNVNSYECGICDFLVHVGCAGLPASTTSSRWDKHHPLLLTHDATLNHPGEFYCDQCEREMNPKSWMYHCRSCNISIHPSCFPITSGWYRNRKLGQEYHVNAETHPHPLTFQSLTTKCRCDVCREYSHEYLGFYCALCIFFICFYCGEKMIKDGNVKAVY